MEVPGDAHHNKQPGPITNHPQCRTVRPSPDPIVPRQPPARRHAARHGPRHAHLPMQVIPVHDGSGARRHCQILALLRLVIGVEHEISGLLDQALAQHDARGGPSVGRRGRKHHGVRVGLLAALPGILQPLGDNAHGLRRHGVTQGRAGRCHRVNGRASAARLHLPRALMLATTQIVLGHESFECRAMTRRLKICATA